MASKEDNSTRQYKARKKAKILLIILSNTTLSQEMSRVTLNIEMVCSTECYSQQGEVLGSKVI